MSDAKKVLEVEFSATDRISEVIGKINKNLQGMEAELTTIATFAGVSFAALAAGIGLDSREAIQAEDSLNKAGSAVKVASQNWDLYREQVQGVTASLQEHTRFSDDDLQRAFAQVVNITGDAGRSLDNLSLITDVATARNIDLGTAADAVGKAMQGQIGRLGVLFPELQRNIEALGDTATDSQRAGVAIGYLSGKFKGLAEEDAKSASGQIAILKNQIGELTESIGAAFLPTVKSLLEKITPFVISLKDWATEHTTLIKVVAGGATVLSGFLFGLATIGLTIPKVIVGIELLSKALIAFKAANPEWLLLATAITGVSLAVGQLGSAMTSSSQTATKLNEQAKNLGVTANYLQGLRNQMFGFGDVDEKKWDEFVSTLPKISDPVKNVVKSIGEVNVVFDASADKLKTLNKELKTYSDLLSEIAKQTTIRSEEGLTGRPKVRQQGFDASHYDFSGWAEGGGRMIEEAKKSLTALQAQGLQFANMFSSNLARVFSQIRSLADLSALKIKDVFQALGDTILDMLAQIAARMVVFGLLSLIPGGGAFLGGLRSFVFGGGGGTNSVGGGNTIPAIVPQNNFSGGGSAGNTYNIQIGRFIGTQENARELGLEIRRLERYGQLY